MNYGCLTTNANTPKKLQHITQHQSRLTTTPVTSYNQSQTTENGGGIQFSQTHPYPFNTSHSATGVPSERVDVPSTSREPIAVTATRELVDCADCDIGYGLFYHLYTGDVERIVKYCQAHGVILSARSCPHCDRLVYVELIISLKAFGVISR